MAALIFAIALPFRRRRPYDRFEIIMHTVHAEFSHINNCTPETPKSSAMVHELSGPQIPWESRASRLRRTRLLRGVYPNYEFVRSVRLPSTATPNACRSADATRREVALARQPCKAAYKARAIALENSDRSGKQ